MFQKAADFPVAPTAVYLGGEVVTTGATAFDVAGIAALGALALGAVVVGVAVFNHK
ncbi:MAG: hypothetical protein V1922_00485 [bacterium]